MGDDLLDGGFFVCLFSYCISGFILFCSIKIISVGELSWVGFHVGSEREWGLEGAEVGCTEKIWWFICQYSHGSGEFEGLMVSTCMRCC